MIKNACSKIARLSWSGGDDLAEAFSLGIDRTETFLSRTFATPDEVSAGRKWASIPAAEILSAAVFVQRMLCRPSVAGKQEERKSECRHKKVIYVTNLDFGRDAVTLIKMTIR